MHKGIERYKSIGLSVAVALAATVGSGSVNAGDKLKIGVTATLEGTYTVLGEDGMRGYMLALEKHGGKAGGKEIETIVGSTDATPDSAVRAAKKLVEQDKVDVLISPLSGAEGIAIRDYSKTQPQITVINAASGAVETTYGDPSAGITPSPTFYRFNMDGAQWHAGLGDYIYNVKHYKKIATIAEDYAFTYTQVMGLTVEYCKAGGQITKRLWVPLGTKDFSSYIPELLSEDVDAIYLGLGGADAVNFLNQYQQAGGNAKLIGGSIMIDQTVLSSKGKAKEALIGTVSASGMADNDPSPAWQAFVKAYQQHPKTGYFKNAFNSPSLLAVNYYDATDAVFNALDQVNGDLSDGNKKFRNALQNMVLDAPNGRITLDENRQAIGTNFVTEVVKDANGNLISKVVKVVPNVQQRLGFSKAVYDKFIPPGRTNPPCKKNYD
ncbi:MAG: ABC transporter substrate-binding protein [Acidobacteriia bacterium]|nr:ABC transporter substrate-binding protein [Methyloceanibacter sp.]MCL6492483.1 ABC transporter substrate-binding protein [Terriglobia bacterium]